MKSGVSLDPQQSDEGLGPLIVTDASLLLKPARSGQYPRSVGHDAVHAYHVLKLANDMSGSYEWHIFCREDPRAAYMLLDRVFYAFVDACCFELWCDATVHYVANGATVIKTEHGFSDGQYSMNMTVHCGAYEEDADELIDALIDRGTVHNESERLVVVRPDESKQGYRAEAFELQP